MTTFKENFKIPKSQPVEFLNIPLNEDLLAFIDPFLIANSQHIPMLKDVYFQTTKFLEKLNRTYIVPNDRYNGLQFLSNLHEPNEYHLGYSDSNKGKAIAMTRAETIFDALSNNKFARSGTTTVTNEAHNVLLLVTGIGQDIMSDTIANVCRNIFAEFTLAQCLKHGIATSSVSMDYYNQSIGLWENVSFDLPSYRGKPIILLPKEIMSSPRGYSNNYNHFIAGNYISKDILSGKIKIDKEGLFVKTMKNGERKAIIKKIYETYKKHKSELIEFVKQYPNSLLSFLDYAKEHYPALDLGDI
jgi:hypothetical protein